MDSSSNRCYRCMNILKKEALVCPNCKNKIQPTFKNSDFLKPGTILSNRYIIGDVISQNHESITYIAFDQHLDAKIAIKEFFPHFLVKRSESGEISLESQKSDLFDKIKLEFANLHDSLSKFRTIPNILKVFSIFFSAGTVYVIQELPQGITLRKYLSKYYGELLWSNCSSMFLELIKSIKHFHDGGIVHGGLSPETLLVYNNQFKITGFSTKYLRIKQKIIPYEIYDGYAAPEQYDIHALGPYSDVYGTAAVMYKSLTGTMPVASNTRSSNDNLIPPEILNPNIPKNVSFAIMSALNLSPKIRTQTMEDFYADIITPPRSSSQETEKIKIQSEFHFARSSIVPDQKHEMKTHKVILLAMTISIGIAVFFLAIAVLILFGGDLF